MTSITVARGAAACGVILLAGCLLLSACGGSSSPSSTSAGGAVHGPAAAPANPPAYGAASAGRNAAGSSASAGNGLATQPENLASASEDIIYTASMTLRTGSPMAAARQAIGIAAAAGGYTAGEDAVSGSADHAASVSLTLKVPVAVYPAVLAELSAPSLGRQIALTQQATDVTQQVADVDSLVTSQQDAIDALDGLLSRAGSIDQLLQVQQQISADESALESLQAQQRALDHETTFATISMTLQGPLHAVHKRHHQAARGFLAGLTAGWRALGHATTAALEGLGAGLPFILLAAILAAAALAAWRRLARRRTGPTPVP
ncbi:MAG TPA: DUF4349 domain-containing protein [Streptosporangiaceae bacterium]|nr:DUF4349 domain-containing protein [Streptosporangiaceae bacterium]